MRAIASQCVLTNYHQSSSLIQAPKQQTASTWFMYQCQVRSSQPNFPADFIISGKVRHLRLWKKLLHSLVIYLTFSQFQPIQISAYACICTLPEYPSLDRERSGILVLMRKLKCRASTSNSVFCARYCVLMLFVFCGLYCLYLLFTSVLFLHPGCPGSKAVKRSLLLLLFCEYIYITYRVIHFTNSWKYWVVDS